MSERVDIEGLRAKLWRGDLDVRDYSVYDDESFVAEFDSAGDADAYADLHNAAPSLLAEVERLRGEVKRVREAVIDSLAKAPAEEPTRYEGDNHGDSFSSGWDCGEFYLANKIRAALAAQEQR